MGGAASIDALGAAEHQVHAEVSKLAKAIVADARKHGLQAKTVSFLNGTRQLLLLGGTYDREGTGAPAKWVRELRAKCNTHVDLLLDRPADKQRYVNSGSTLPLSPYPSDIELLDNEFRRAVACKQVRLTFNNMRERAAELLANKMLTTTFIGSIPYRSRIELLEVLHEAVAAMSRHLQSLLRSQSRFAPTPLHTALRKLLHHVADWTYDPQYDVALQKQLRRVEVAGGEDEDTTAAMDRAVSDRVQDMHDRCEWLSDVYMVAQLYRADGRWAPLVVAYQSFATVYKPYTLIRYIEAHGGRQCKHIEWEVVNKTSKQKINAVMAKVTAKRLRHVKPRRGEVPGTTAGVPRAAGVPGAAAGVPGVPGADAGAPGVPGAAAGVPEDPGAAAGVPGIAGGAWW